MAPRSEDQAFSRYRQTGRAEFLGQVFDETAPGLLLVACHLLRGAESAEDLVQSTFVTAIEVAGRYDATQPVFRWLAGILANHARAARRRAQRPLDAARLPAEPSAAPDAEAEAGEIAAAVTHALDGMPETYRTVLVLRLLHGLEPIEVAHALGRSPETVRTQLHRGLTKLRAALPESLTLAALATVVLEGRGLAAVRAAVMGRVAVTAPAAATATATAFGGLLMANKMIVAAACAVLLLGGAAVWRAIGSAGVSGADEPGAPLTVAAAESRAAQDTGTGGFSEPARMPVADASTASSDATVLAGRCVAAEHRAPLAGCTVTLEARAGRGARAPSWHDPRQLATGPDGRFRFSFVLPEGCPLSASVVLPGRVPVSASWQRLPAGSTLDVGDVSIPLGGRVRGQVVDEADGKEIANAGIAAELLPLPFGSQAGDHDRASGRSDAGGWFDLGTLPIGDHALEVLGRDYQLVAPKRVVLTGMDGTVEQRVVLRATPSLQGTVVDPAGVPIAGISVSESTGGSSDVRTNARGEFRLHARADSRSPVRLEFVQFPTVLEPISVQPSGPWSWGTRDIRVTLPRPDPKSGSGARLRVVDATTGAAIEEFGYMCKPDQTRLRGGSTSEWDRKQQSGRHEHGIVELTDLHPSAHLAVIYPADESLLAGGPVFFEVQRGAVAEVEVRLRRPTDCRVQVVRRDGRPVAGAEVELLHAFGPGPVSLVTRAMPMERPDMSPGPDHLALLRATAATGPDGVAVLRAPAGEVGMTVRVLPVECLGLLVRDVAIPATQTEPLRVVVDSGATLHGRVVPADVVQRMARRDPPLAKAAGLTLMPSSGDGRLRLPTFGDCFAVAEDGSFRISGVPPGAWSLHLYWLAPPVEGQFMTHWFRPALATVTVAEGQETELELDARAFRPAAVRGRILLGDQPLGNTTWCLLPLDGGFGGPGIGGRPTDADGRFESDAVLPGRYSLAVLPGKRGKSGRTWRQVLEPLEVGPGDSVDRTFHVAPATSLTLLLTTADGATPVADHTLLWIARLGGNMSLTFSGEVTTDASGTARLDPVLALPIEFHREPNEAERQLPWGEQQRSTLLGTVEREPEQSELRARFRLPAK